MTAASLQPNSPKSEEQTHGHATGTEALGIHHATLQALGCRRILQAMHKPQPGPSTWTLPRHEPFENLQQSLIDAAACLEREPLQPREQVRQKLALLLASGLQEAPRHGPWVGDACKLAMDETEEPRWRQAGVQLAHSWLKARDEDGRRSAITLLCGLEAMLREQEDAMHEPMKTLAQVNEPPKTLAQVNEPLKTLCQASALPERMVIAWLELRGHGISNYLGWAIMRTERSLQQMLEDIDLIGENRLIVTSTFAPAARDTPEFLLLQAGRKAMASGLAAILAHPNLTPAGAEELGEITRQRIRNTVSSDGHQNHHSWQRLRVKMLYEKAEEILRGWPQPLEPWRRQGLKP